MTGQLSRAIVPYLQSLPTRFTGAAQPAPAPDGFDLVQSRTQLRNRVEVERHLPDIIGRVLARVWIDPRFRERFAADPKGTLAAHHVHLPDAIDIGFEADGQRRPCVVVHERLGPQLPPRRLLYLQLVMVAGR